ncbi:MAG: translational GTPase TypA, partial [Candidatus Absconditabacteria bacterium]|nr:translational GTPase TypA [Candidatus Absconditabacteria bacterium]
FREEKGKKQEPIENLVVSVNDDLSGTVIEAISNRKGQMVNMHSLNGLTTIEFEIPTRGLLGFRGEFILMTKGEGIMYSSFSHYEDWKGEIKKREVGSMISSATGQAMNYGIFKLQERGPIFVQPAQQVYEGMIVGEYLKGNNDMTVNLTINKQQNNVRNSGNDEAMRLNPIRTLSLEDALGYIGHDELVEITPKNVRVRKKYLTDSARKLAEKGGKI